MPLYDVQCTVGCGYFTDVFALMADADKMICAKCGAPVRRLIRPVVTVGPMPSKPLRVEQIGRTFESNAQFREYKRANGDVEILGANSQAWRKHVDLAREKSEKSARAAGFRDREERMRHLVKTKKQAASHGS